MNTPVSNMTVFLILLHIVLSLRAKPFGSVKLLCRENLQLMHKGSIRVRERKKERI